MKKLVNIQTRSVIKVHTAPPIRGSIEGIKLTTQDIFDCICQKGIVDEVLSNKTLVRLDLSNYETDHEATLLETANKVKEAEQKEIDAAAAKLAEQTRLAQEKAAKEAADFARQEQAKLDAEAAKARNIQQAQQQNQQQKK